MVKFWGTLQGTPSTTPPINGNRCGVWSVDIKTVSVVILPDSLRFFGPIMPTTLGKTTPPGRWTSPDHAKEQTDAARRRAQKTQLMRRRRAELTPSNQDLDKAQNTQSKRRRRAELSPEDAQRRKAMDALWRRRLNSARAAGRGRVLESMS